MVCLLAGVLVLSASKDNSLHLVDVLPAPTVQQDGEALLDIPMPFEVTVHCFVNGEDRVLVIHRRLRLFFLPVSPQAALRRRSQNIEECE